MDLKCAYLEQQYNNIMFPRCVVADSVEKKQQLKSAPNKTVNTCSLEHHQQGSQEGAWGQNPSIHLGCFEMFPERILPRNLGPGNLRKFGPPGSPWMWAWEEEKTIKKRCQVM